MSNEKVMNRWIVVVAALVIQISLGAVYIWSVFQTPLNAAFPDWTETQVTLPAQLVLAFFAFAVVVGGRIQDKLGPRIVGTVGGIIGGTGLLLARFTEYFDSGPALIWLNLTFAVLGGIGIGTGYVCPVATCVKWFPDKRGLITGLAVAGFGAGAFVLAPLARGLITGGAYQLFGVDLFPVPGVGIFNTFLVLGVLFLVTVVLGSQWMRNPPPGYVPAGWTPPVSAAGAAPGGVNFTPSEMLKTPMFWILWLTYFAGCTAGLQLIMKASPIWQSFAVGTMTEFPVSMEQFAAVGAAGATVVSILAIFNSAGRILWGKVSDNIGRKQTLILIFVICGMTMLSLNWMRAFPLYLLGACIVGLCYGGFLALYPAITADFYGTKHMGVNYGFMFLAFGAGGFAGPFLAAFLMRVAKTVEYQALDAAGQMITKAYTVGDYRLAFFISGGACLAAAALSLLIKPPKAKAA